MLLQSHAGAIHLLPALPRAWAEGQFTGLRARGGFTVDAAWKGGRLTSATVHSTLGGPCLVRANCRLAAKEGGREIVAKRDLIDLAKAEAGGSSDGLIQFETSRGGTYTLTPETLNR